MENLTVFLIQLGLCIGISIAVIAFLKPYLNDVLTDICGMDKRAAFWVMFSQLILLIAPLLLVILFSQVSPELPVYPLQAIKDALFRSLLGVFVAIAVIGWVIWSSVVPRSGGTALPHQPNSQAGEK